MIQLYEQFGYCYCTLTPIVTVIAISISLELNTQALCNAFGPWRESVASCSFKGGVLIRESTWTNLTQPL